MCQNLVDQCVFGEFADFKEDILKLFTGVTACSNIVNNKTIGMSVAITRPFRECIIARAKNTDSISSVEDPTEKHFKLLHNDRFA